MKQYRIGDYAKYVGVTPDFLKHYEEMGIIQSNRSESGYRYYSFHTTIELIESIRLRNYGIPLREIREFLHGHKTDNEQMDQILSEKIEMLRQEIQLDEALVADYDVFLRWREELAERGWDWEIRRSSPMLFLPHTDRYDFLKDQRIYEILNSWMSYIPIVKSSLKLGPDGQVTWGFIAAESDVLHLSLPVNEVVERIPAKKTFYYKFRSATLRLHEESRDNIDHPAFRLLRSLQLESEDTYFRTTVMPADWKQNLGYQYGFYAIPLKE